MRQSSLFAVLAVTVVGVAVAVAQVSSNSQSSSSSGSATASSSAQSGAQLGGSTTAAGSSTGVGSNYQNVSGQMFLVMWEPTQARNQSARDIETAHREYINNFAMRSGIMMEGFFPDGTGRMALVGSTEKVANEVAANSPLVLEGLAKYRVKEWTVTHSYLYAPGQSASAPPVRMRPPGTNGGG